MNLRLQRVLLLLALLFASLPGVAESLAVIPKLDSPVIDTTGTLTPAQQQALVQQALALQQRKGSQLQVLMVPTTQPETIEQYATRVFDQFKLGRKGVDDGVLVVVAKDDHRVRIEPGYGLEGAIPDAIANRIIQEYMAPKFRANDYAGGLADADAALAKLIDGEALPAPIASNASRGKGGGDWMFALFAAFFVAQIARGILGRAPSVLRGIIGAGVAGGAAWLISSVLLIGGLGAAIGFFLGLIRPSAGGFARGGGFGGFGGGGGGGWSGGGGMSGGGGASGGW